MGVNAPAFSAGVAEATPWMRAPTRNRCPGARNPIAGVGLANLGAGCRQIPLLVNSLGCPTSAKLKLWTASPYETEIPSTREIGQSQEGHPSFLRGMTPASVTPENGSTTPGITIACLPSNRRSSFPLWISLDPILRLLSNLRLL